MKNIKIFKYHKMKISYKMAKALLMCSAFLLLFSSQSVYAAKLKNPTVSDTSTTWDCIWFGTYPQTEIQKPSTSIIGADYGGDGIAFVGEIKYKRIKKSDALYAAFGNGYYDWLEGGDDNGYHYFKYEKIKWRVLYTNGKKALLLADTCLDCRQYNEVIADVTWKNSDIRKFLNGDFLNAAFSAKASSAIVKTTISKDDNTEYGTDGGNSTTDSIWLLSEKDAKNTKYGFDASYEKKDAARRAGASVYAQAMGVYTGTDEEYTKKASWWLRSPGDENDAAIVVSNQGYFSPLGELVDSRIRAVRPALYINLSSKTLYAYAGTVSDTGVVKEKNADWSEGGNTRKSRSIKTKKKLKVQLGGKSKKIKVNVKGKGKITYKSKNKKVADISKKGRIKAKKCGIAVITIKVKKTARYKKAKAKVKVKVVPTKVKIDSLFSPAKSEVKSSWKNIPHVSGFQFYMSRSKNFDHMTLKRESKKHYTYLTHIPGGKTWYVRVRAYKKVGKKRYYGKWSNVRALKVK